MLDWLLRRKKVPVLVWYDPATGEEEFVELRGKIDAQYGVVFGPSEVAKWVRAHDAAIARHKTALSAGYCDDNSSH